MACLTLKIFRTSLLSLTAFSAGCPPTLEETSATDAPESSSGDLEDTSSSTETEGEPIEVLPTTGVEADTEAGPLVVTDDSLLRDFEAECYPGLAVDAKGDLYLAGTRAGDPACVGDCPAGEMVARKLDPAGADLVLVLDAYARTGERSDGVAIAPRADGGFVIAGRRVSADERPLLQARDPEGALLWHELAGAEVATALPLTDVVVSSTELVLTTGRGGELLRFQHDGAAFGEVGAPGGPLVALALDGSQMLAVAGEGFVRRFTQVESPAWEVALPGAVTDVATTPAGETVVVGVAQVDGSAAPFVRRYDVQGALTWAREVEVESGDGALAAALTSVALLADGRVAAAGNVAGDDGTAALWIYSGDGDLLEVRHFDHPAREHEVYRGVAATAGGVALTGCSADDGWVRIESL